MAGESGGSGSGGGGDDGKRRWKRPKPGEAAKSSGRRGKQRRVTAYNAESESSKRWIERQLSDPYVQRAKADGYRARAAYKLKEIDGKARILKPGLRVLDLGCAPGGWLQVAVEGQAVAVAGIDLLAVEPVAGAAVFQGDARDPDIMAEVLAALGGRPDLVLSDMAANTTGHRQTDMARTNALADLAAGIAEDALAPGGAFVSKVFGGGADPALLERLKSRFDRVRHIKPDASRKGSPEIFLVATGFRGR